MVPEKCEKCDHTRFREQERPDGNVFFCKACGHEHKPKKEAKPTENKETKPTENKKPDDKK